MEETIKMQTRQVRRTIMMARVVKVQERTRDVPETFLATNEVVLVSFLGFMCGVGVSGMEWTVL